jgi:L-alanine-DL-glutamate epimerase-like enolase superfamily enzyme
MKILDIRLTPLLVPYAKPYYWAQGIIHGAEVILVEVETDTGVIGYGESIATPSASGVIAFLQAAAAILKGRDPFDNARLMADCNHQLFQAFGTCSAPRFSGQVLAGLEMALWDVMGKASDRPVHQLLGGARHDRIGYFGFPQGKTPEEIAAEAGQMAMDGHEVIYVKLGQGDEIDLEILAQTRAAIGPRRRLRVDPNEHWPGTVARRMLPQIAKFDIEFVEQPVDAESLSALANLRAVSPIAIAADQSVFTPYDAYEICRQNAADLVVLGLHETGGLHRFLKAATICEAAGISVCAHGLYETGITTCATHQAAATLPNLDNGNQYMAHFLAWDLVRSPELRNAPRWMPVLNGPGLGFTLDPDAVAKAAALHTAQSRHL